MINDWTQSNAPMCQQILKYGQEGWPNKSRRDPELKPYWEARGDLTEGDGLLMHGQRIVVPKLLQQETLQKLHGGHQGILRCRLKANISVWWPSLSKQLKSYTLRNAQSVPEMPKSPKSTSFLPPYQHIHGRKSQQHLDGKEYIVLVDYFSRFPEVKKLKSTTQSVVNTMKTLFAQYGIPEILRSDNGPQFSSRICPICREVPVQACHEQPHFPASNGQVERAVQTVKMLLKNSEDPFLTLLSYRATPLPWCGRSPAELLMGRKICSTLPMPTSTLVPEWPYVKEFQQANEKFKQQQKADYDRCHRVQDLPEIPDNTDVWITTGGHPVAGRTVTMAETPRSYIVQTPTGEMRRNRSQLNIAPPTADTQTADDIPQTASHTEEEQARSPIMTRSRTGTHIAPPNRL